jgi:hypothetical protein
MFDVRSLVVRHCKIQSPVVQRTVVRRSFIQRCTVKPIFLPLQNEMPPTYIRRWVEEGHMYHLQSYICTEKVKTKFIYEILN